MTDELAPEGFYGGEITEAWSEEKDQEDDSLRVCFSVRLDSGHTVECRHRAFGDRADKTAAIVKSLGLEWPGGIEQIETAAGKRVRVNVRHNVSGNRTYVNGYIVLGGGRKADPEKVKAAVARLASQTPAPGDDLPF